MKKNFFILVAVILLLVTLISCASNEDTTIVNEKAIYREELCDEISYYWGGVFIRYKNMNNFNEICNLITYDTHMELIQKVRSIIPDGHFYIGLPYGHPENKFSEAKVIPVVTTYDLYDNAVIAKSTEKYREIGLKEGNIILKINNTETRYYIDTIMKLLPQSSFYETKEKAYRLLFTNVLSLNSDTYFELYTFDYNAPLDITYLDTETGEVNMVSVEFEDLMDNLPDDPMDLTMNGYWSIRRYYDVPEENTCSSNNEFAVMKEVNGKKWFVYNLQSFSFRPNNIAEDFECYNKFIEEADYMVLDFRDSVGGMLQNINTVLGLVGAENETKLMFGFGDEDGFEAGNDVYLTPTMHEELKSSSKKIPIYIWANAIAGSCVDIFLHAVRSSGDKHIKIVGRPSAGRVIAISYRQILDFNLTLPVSSICDEYGIQMEGKAIFPDYYFDVVAEDYTSPDLMLQKYINFIKQTGLLNIAE